MVEKGFAGNVVSSLKYQVSRRANNVISSIISVSTLLGFLWLVRQLAQTYWPAFIRQYWDKRQLVYLAIMISGSLFSNAVNMGIYYVIDKYKLFEQYKITKTGLMWQDDKEKWKVLRNKAIKLNFINIVLVGSTLTFVDSMVLSDTTVAPEIPSFSTMFLQFFFCVMVEGALFYVFHKVGHLYLYSLHKVHHEFHVPTPLATTYFHPIDYILGVLIPFSAGPKLLGNKIHLVTIFFWMIFRIGEGHDGHSNYEFPWSPYRALPLSTTSEYHSFHHTHNEGNFGSTDMVPDTVMYDNSSFFKYKQQSKQTQKEQNGSKANAKKGKTA